MFFHNASDNCLMRTGAFFYFPCQTKTRARYSQASRKRCTAARVNGRSRSPLTERLHTILRGARRELQAGACGHGVRDPLSLARGVPGSTGRAPPQLSPAELFARSASPVTLLSATRRGAACQTSIVEMAPAPGICRGCPSPGTVMENTPAANAATQQTASQPLSGQMSQVKPSAGKS